MLKARIEARILQTNVDTRRMLDVAIAELDTEIRTMPDGIDRDHLAAVRTMFHCCIRLLSPEGRYK